MCIPQGVARLTAGLGPLKMFKSETMQILGGIGGVCAAGAVTYFSYAAYSAPRRPSLICLAHGHPADAPPSPRPSSPAVKERLPPTMTPQWKAATAKYRAAQNQDPIAAMQ